ncbi:putative neuronal acetylcholine receptor subunit alpha-9-II-like [Apostichopus japonicus]|uniref:Putative neuronal acetylcholine receptor subunit alpha-9-II-like n=1 Tax=Stichopus japonicus TaxID=307972 RepID=A0A2G8KK69_STIJA|nr:putative neuronal acetylcholine receptor subunit alpha-9-II-like [Apostichopus japonicus]
MAKAEPLIATDLDPTRTIWTDEYMRWDPSDYEGLKKTKVSSNKIWLPDLFFYNNADQLYHKFLKDTIVKVDFSGEVLWASPVNFRSFCLLDVRFFPFDVQLCEMKFGPWSHDGNELVINGSGDTSAFTANGEWDMSRIVALNNVEYYPDDPGVPYTDVTFKIYFHRSVCDVAIVTGKIRDGRQKELFGFE